jgi:hypothetical protein
VPLNQIQKCERVWTLPAGFVRQPGSSEEIHARVIRRMLAPIAHRGPNHSGSHILYPSIIKIYRALHHRYHQIVAINTPFFLIYMAEMLFLIVSTFSSF